MHQDQILVCEMNKALKQTPKEWYEKHIQALIQFGFSHTKFLHSLFVNACQSIPLYALAYVDDIIVIGSSSNICTEKVRQTRILFGDRS